MEKEKALYRDMTKSTVLLAGIKIVEILVMMIRIKVVAIILGPMGMGIQSVLQSSLATINQFSSLGIYQSSVREIAQNKDDVYKKSEMLSIVMRLSFCVAVLGGIICIVFSKMISHFVFKSDEYTVSFVFLSLASIFWSLSNGNITIMQGCRQLKKLAFSSLLGASISLLCILPIYWFLGIKGIVPALIVSYFILYVVNFIYRRRIYLERVSVSFYTFFEKGRSIVSLGIVLMFSNLLMTLFSFLMNAFIARYGNILDIGLFQAAFTITYGNLIILVSVLTSDFYPRLSFVHKDVGMVNLMVNQQIEFFLLIIAPISILLIILAPFAVRTLYSESFISVVPVLRWMVFALIFRLLWYSFSFIILSKADTKTFFIYDAILGNGLTFILNVVFYKIWGLPGLGFSFVISSVFVSLLLLFVVSMKYEFKLDKKNILLLIYSILFFVLTYVSFVLFENLFCGILFCGISIVLSLNRLNMRLGLITYINSFLKK